MPVIINAGDVVSSSDGTTYASGYLADEDYFAIVQVVEVL